MLNIFRSLSSNQFVMVHAPPIIRKFILALLLVFPTVAGWGNPPIPTFQGAKPLAHSERIHTPNSDSMANAKKTPLKKTPLKKLPSFLESLISEKGSPFLKRILADSQTYSVQIRYTRIDRDAQQRPRFTSYTAGVSPQTYFYPASTVKFPMAVLAVEKLNLIPKALGVNLNSPMLTDSAFPGQTAVLRDESSANGFPSIGHYIKKIFLVSDNDAYNRLYEWVGQDFCHNRFLDWNWNQAQIVRRFVPTSTAGNAHTNPITFLSEDSKTVLYKQPLGIRTFNLPDAPKIFIGKGFQRGDGSISDQPLEFTQHNRIHLHQLEDLMKKLLFPEMFKNDQSLHITPEQRSFLLTWMGAYPSEAKYPQFDTTTYFDSYNKFFCYTNQKVKPPASVRIFNKTGMAYGSLTDVSYFTDRKMGVEFLLTATIYVNKDEILNDDQYEYDEVGFPFFEEIGNLIYQYELNRKKKVKPSFTWLPNMEELNQ